MFRHNLSNPFYKLNYFDLKEDLCLLIFYLRFFEFYVFNPFFNIYFIRKFSNPKILDKEHNLEKRLILEMIKILNNKNSINKRSDMDCFSNIYKKFLEKNHFS